MPHISQAYLTLTDLGGAMLACNKLRTGGVCALKGGLLDAQQLIRITTSLVAVYLIYSQQLTLI